MAFRADGDLPPEGDQGANVRDRGVMSACVRATLLRDKAFTRPFILPSSRLSAQRPRARQMQHPAERYLLLRRPDLELGRRGSLQLDGIHGRGGLSVDRLRVLRHQRSTVRMPAE